MNASSTPSGRPAVSSPTATAPTRNEAATTGLGPNRSAKREAARAPRTAPPLSTRRKASEPLVEKPARPMSSGSQVFSV
jgi:hypothetical protein